jgi:DNA-directed RNA polymerase alpha subunit
MRTPTLRTCAIGHQYLKSSDCPVCPVCEKNQREESFFTGLAAPARRALATAGIDTLNKLSGYSEKELLAIHGLGPGSLPALKKMLKQKGLAFKKEK